jgi:hypothetical protein
MQVYAKTRDGRSISMKIVQLAAVVLLILSTILAGCMANTSGTTAATQALATTAPKATEALNTPGSVDPKEAKLTGLMLDVPVLNDRAEIVYEDVGEDGTYLEQLEWGKEVFISIQRLPRVDFNKEAVVTQIGNQNEGDTKDWTIAQDAGLSGRLSYPAWRCTYTSGADSLTKKNADIYIQTDSWDFRFGVCVPTDLYGDYSDTIEDWFASLTLVTLK